MNTDLIVGVLIGGFVFFVLNAVFLSIIFFTQRKVNQVSQWPATPGIVIDSRLEARSSEDGYTDYPVVHYTYQVGGRAYHGQRIAPGAEVGGTGASKVVGRYPAGAQVTVFYNPQNPSEAVLEKKAPAQTLMWVLLILFDVSLCCIAPVMFYFFGAN